LQYYLNARLSDKWSINFDASYRRTDNLVNKPLQWLLRGGASYHVSNDVSFTAGYAYFSLHTITSKSEFGRSEHRPWLRFTIAQKYGKLQIQHRYRFESRNIQKNDENGLINDYKSYFRTGYQLNFQYIPNGKKIDKGTFYLIAFNELFVNFGSEVLNNFDQNRAYIGLGYCITKNTNLTFGYQHVYSQQNATNFSDLNTLRLNVVQNIDFQKPKEEPQSDSK
jgi:long-subunit fatty acid transport protein